MIKGNIFKYGDDINTDVIYPGKYTYTISDYEEMAEHALEDLDETFVEEVQAGDVIVGGKNFGCGSSREQAVICLKYNNVGAIIAVSFSRIFFRNCINQGVPAITLLQDVIATMEKGDAIEVDVEEGKVFHDGKEYTFQPYSDEIRAIIECGGIIPYTKKAIRKK